MSIGVSTLRGIEVPGAAERVAWGRKGDDLGVTLPASPSQPSYALKIEFNSTQ